MTHSECDKTEAAPDNCAAAKCPWITGIRRSASRCIVIGVEEATREGWSVMGSSSVPSSDKV